MPHSDQTNKQFTRDWLTMRLRGKKHIRTLDVGAGSGAYGRMTNDVARDLRISKTNVAIEAWEPYIEEWNLRKIYDEILLKDAREHEDFNYDVVYFGDVLEHMSSRDSILLFSKAREQADIVVVSVPIVHYPQGAEHGNPYEVHVQEHPHDWEIQLMFGHPAASQKFEVTGVFIYD